MHGKIKEGVKRKGEVVLFETRALGFQGQNAASGSRVSTTHDSCAAERPNERHPSYKHVIGIAVRLVRR
jgi:hypothetical protein